MTENRGGWLVDSERTINTSNQFSLATVVGKLSPLEIENEAKNIRLERALFVEDDKSPIYRRAMRLVKEEEWNTRRRRYKQLPYLIIPFKKKDGLEDEIKELLNQDLFLKESVDLREFFSSPVLAQEGMTCTAFAGKSLMEYFQNRANNTFNSKLSWRFLYKVARELMRIDLKENESPMPDGTTLRDTLRAMVLFGVPPENSDKSWLLNASDLEDYSNQPSAFAFAYAQNFQSSNYFRLDKLRENYEKGLLTIDHKAQDAYIKSNNDLEVGQLTVAQIRIALEAGFPSIFGISNPYFLSKWITTEGLKEKEKENKYRKLGQIEIPQDYSNPLPTLSKAKEKKTKSRTTIQPKTTTGHALVAVGYDDNLEFDNPESGKPLFKGGFLFRDSQGSEWGDQGYGWMPYEYVEKGLVTDWWSLLNAEWTDSSVFGIGTDQILGCCQCGSKGCPARPNCC